MDLNQIKIELKRGDNYEKIFQRLEIEYEVFGDNLYCCCPIHNHSDNPRAFSYSINKGYWKCWTRSCQDDHKSDLLGLIGAVLSKRIGSEVSFKDVLKWTCEVLQIQDGTRTKKYNTAKQETQNPYEDIINLVDIFSTKNTHNQATQSIIINDKITHSKYFLDRGFSKTTLDHFTVYENTNIAALKDRAIIPIHDDTGDNIVGLIGRSTKEYKIPKFLIFPKGFDKKFYLYNYHRALSRAIETSCLFLVEGQGDVWRLYEAGVTNAVSMFGKSVTSEQEQKINQIPVTKLVVLTDNDQAGREAKTQIKRQFSRSHSVYFPKIYAKDIGDMSAQDIQDKVLSQLKGLY